jgi:hypothetical protein
MCGPRHGSDDKRRDGAHVYTELHKRVAKLSGGAEPLPHACLPR